ncbi:hypothetical protein SDC9_07706 [bioreactor metagenome]|uniref:B12-binding domain-containing protein n=1 Tax=bioreactor metagenome TaxID=1076179 RepID=A0A644T6I1_9ZZZZ|nr:cobalamin-dependent protein [Methanobrevibacter sp.]MEA4956571.1 cobalamin-dependent protein [Methanobrevibacter sp.]
MIKELVKKSKIKKALLVEPNFPIANKSRNHKDFLPIGLLKISSYLKSKDIEVKLLRFDEDLISGTIDFKPDIVFVTSLFTYWSSYVTETVKLCKKKFGVDVIVGGIYASLMPEDCKKNTGCDYVHCGVFEEAEKLIPDYDLVDVDYQIIHSTRGCIRRCGPCGVYEIEPKFTYKKSIKEEIIKKKIIFYDNNFLANKYVENILNELIELKKEKKINYCESQSGFDGRILNKKPFLGKLLKKSGFKNPKIAWDGSFDEKDNIRKQVNILIESGFKPSEISIFVLYNFEIPYVEMERKRVEAWKLGVQISDCRYRPLSADFDNYSPHKRTGQSKEDYFIHPKWTDEEIRLFRRNIRSHNICIRLGSKYYSPSAERKRISIDLARKYRMSDYKTAKKHIQDAWNPAEFHENSKSHLI